MLGFNTALLGLIFLALLIAAVHPMGAVQQCRQAVEQARETMIAMRR